LHDLPAHGSGVVQPLGVLEGRESGGGVHDVLATQPGEPVTSGDSPS
jgi:hypothetical protein